MALSGKSLNDFCCNWNCSQTNMKFISTHSISHFPHEWRTVCVCVICFPCWCSMTVLPSSSGSIFTVHLLLQNHSVTALYHLSLSVHPSLPPSLPLLPVTFAVCLNGWAWSRPIIACFERAGHLVEAIHYWQLTRAAPSLPPYASPVLYLSLSLSPVPLACTACSNSSHSSCMQLERG